MRKIILMWCLLASFGAHAAIVYDNGGPPSVHYGAIGFFGTYESVDPSCFGTCKDEPADNFTLLTTSEINSVGFYVVQSPVGPDWNQGITYNIYSDSNGAPGALIATGKSGSIVVTDTGQLLDEDPAFLVTFNLEDTLVLGPGEYWLGVTDAAAFYGVIGWYGAWWVSSTPEGTGSAYHSHYDSLGYSGSVIPFDLAFYLDSERIAVPVLFSYNFGFIGSEDDFSGTGSFTISASENQVAGTAGLEAFEFSGMCAGYPCSFDLDDLINTGDANWSVNENTGEVQSMGIGAYLYPPDTDMEWQIYFLIWDEPGSEISLSCYDTTRPPDAGPCNGGYWDYRAETYPGPESFLTLDEHADFDDDGVPDTVDNCPTDANPEQTNTDGVDDVGDACDTDDDNDYVLDVVDNCPLTPNHQQKDIDTDGVGDACDNCPLIENSDQADLDDSGRGDVCDGSWPGC